jgi:hypothetical protein
LTGYQNPTEKKVLDAGRRDVVRAPVRWAREGGLFEPSHYIEIGVPDNGPEDLSMEEYRKGKKKSNLSVLLILGFGVGGIVLLWQNIEIAGRGDSNLMHDFLLMIVLTIVLGLICRNFFKLWQELDNARNQIEEIQRRTSE